jgi:hypothetical protein
MQRETLNFEIYLARARGTLLLLFLIDVIIYVVIKVGKRECSTDSNNDRTDRLSSKDTLTNSEPLIPISLNT